MRTVIISVITIGILGYLGVTLYQRGLFNGDLVPFEVTGGAYSYPDRVEIESADGRMMMATLLSRSETHVEFSRDDQEAFVYPIASLEADSQALVRRYPNVGIINATSTTSQRADASVGVGELYVQGLEQSIRRIDEKLAGLSSEYSGSSRQVERRTIRRSMESLQAEKVELQLKIVDRK